MIKQHHVVLDHAKPPRLRISFRSRRIFLALKIPSLIHVRTRAIETGFFVVPEDEADRSIGLDIGAAQHAGDFHHERCAGAVVVCRFTPTMAIHVRAKDIHFLGMRDTDLRTVDLFARTRHRGLTVELEERSEEHTSELQSPCNLVCRLLLEKKNPRTAGRRAWRSQACRTLRGSMI